MARPSTDSFSGSFAFESPATWVIIALTFSMMNETASFTDCGTSSFAFSAAA